MPTGGGAVPRGIRKRRELELAKWVKRKRCIIDSQMDTQGFCMGASLLLAKEIFWSDN